MLEHRSPAAAIRISSLHVIYPRSGTLPQPTEWLPPTTRRRTSKVLTPRTPPPVVIECVEPELDGGRYAVKRAAGDTFVVRADILKDGHDLLAARLRYSAPDDAGGASRPCATT